MLAEISYWCCDSNVKVSRLSGTSSLPFRRKWSSACVLPLNAFSYSFFFPTPGKLATEIASFVSGMSLINCKDSGPIQGWFLLLLDHPETSFYLKLVTGGVHTARDFERCDAIRRENLKMRQGWGIWMGVGGRGGGVHTARDCMRQRESARESTRANQLAIWTKRFGIGKSNQTIKIDFGTDFTIGGLKSIAPNI